MQTTETEAHRKLVEIELLEQSAHSEITKIQRRLLAINHKTTSILIMDKTQAALSKLKAARTLIEQAELTLEWADARMRNPLPGEL